MRLIFAGTPDTAVPALELLAREHEVAAVLTRAPAPVGRKRILTKSAVHDKAEELGLKVITPRTLRDPQVQREIANLGADLVAVVAYGLLIPPELLAVPKYGWINLHFSLLPRWRGAAPVQYAIAAGDTETGTAVFQIERGLDTGPIFDVERTTIGASETAGDLLDRLSISGAAQLARVVAQIESGAAQSYEQAGEPTLAPRFSSKNTGIDWAQPAKMIDAQVRGWYPAPGAWAVLDGKRVKLGPVVAGEVMPAGADLPGSAGAQESSGQLVVPGDIFSDDGAVYVVAGSGSVRLGEVAPAGKRWMPATDWLRGLKHTAFEVNG